MRRLHSLLLFALLALGAPAGATQPSFEVRRDVEYGTANGKRLLLDAYVPPGRAPSGGRRS